MTWASCFSSRTMPQVRPASADPQGPASLEGASVSVLPSSLASRPPVVPLRAGGAGGTGAPEGKPLLGPAPEVDMAAAATAAFVMADHQVGWHDIEDTVVVYHWILRGTEALAGLPAGMQVFPTAGQAASFLHGHRARQGRDVPCGWCLSDLRPPRDLVEVDECAVATTRYVFAGHPTRAGEALEMLLVYLWVVATSRPLGDGTRAYDQGPGALRFLHAWRVEQGLEQQGRCGLCADAAAARTPEADADEPAPKGPAQPGAEQPGSE